MRGVLITMMVLSVFLAGCKKNANNNQQQAQQQVQKQVQPQIQQQAQPQVQLPSPVVQSFNKQIPVTQMNNLVTPLSPEAAQSSDRVLVETVFTCTNKSKFTARFKPNTMEIDIGWHKTVVMIKQFAASGFWYKNAQYDMRGKGNEAVLTIQGRSPVVCKSGK